jgi:cell division protein FtsI (penicillin-binding protein 3)
VVDHPKHNNTEHLIAKPHRGRFVAVFILIAAIVLLLVIRYGEIMLGASSETGTTPTANFERGAILDRNGRILAVHTELETIWAWRPEIEDPDEVAQALAPITGQDVDMLARRLAGNTGSVTIKRTVSPSEAAAVREAQSSGELTGVRLRPDYGRTYPERNSLGAVLGYVGTDGDGLAGIELTMQQQLLANESGSGFGNQVFLTIDMNIQYESERLAQAALEEHEADSVTLITLDAKTGDILGLASVPGFDPNNFSSYSDAERRNRPIAEVYEPGSVFKIFSIGSFLQLGGIDMDDQFAADGVYEVTDPPITDLANYGTITTSDIIRLSSNVGAAGASESVEARPFYNMLRLFGFGEPTGIELNGEERGLLARPEDWSGRTQPTLAIGQEIAVTALQLTAAATVYANDGVLLKPNIVDKIVSPDGRVIRDYGRTPVREVLSPWVASQVLLAMEEAVANSGTARRLAYDGVRVAAKTGTAEKVDPRTGEYSDEAFIASTLAILPVEDPQYIVYMAIDYPKTGEFYGGRIVTPVVRDYFDFLVPYEGIPVDGQQRLTHSGQISVQPIDVPEIGETIPDYSGLPKRVLLPLLEREDLAVYLNGFGWVQSQDPPPGTPFEPGMELRLEFE